MEVPDDQNLEHNHGEADINLYALVGSPSPNTMRVSKKSKIWE